NRNSSLMQFKRYTAEILLQKVDWYSGLTLTGSIGRLQISPLERLPMSRDQLPTHDREPWWAHLLAGIVLLGITWFLYFDLSRFEVEGGTRRMQWIVALAYNNFGKWPILGFFSLAGVGLIGLGISRRVSSIAGQIEARTKQRSARRTYKRRI